MRALGAHRPQRRGLPSSTHCPPPACGKQAKHIHFRQRRGHWHIENGGVQAESGSFCVWQYRRAGTRSQQARLRAHSDIASYMESPPPPPPPYIPCSTVACPRPFYCHLLYSQALLAAQRSLSGRTTALAILPHYSGLIIAGCGGGGGGGVSS